jgi:pyruvate dehydrogenase E1 component alpha subunit
VRQVRETGRPYCIEAVTYRFSGHGAADILQPYRPKEEVEKHRQRDPIQILKNRLSEVCGLSEEDVKEMDEWATDVAAKAVKFAEESPQPAPEELFTDVVAEHGPRPVRESEHE